jgi:hypothetical protein
MAGLKEKARKNAKEPVGAPAPKKTKLSTLGPQPDVSSPIQRVKIPFGVANPSDETYSRLVEPISEKCDVQTYLFVNLAAVKLFEFVTVSSTLLESNKENMLEFKCVSWIFWSAFFANQRGCKVTSRPTILTHIISKTSQKFYNTFNDNVLLQTEFEKVHDSILEHFFQHAEIYMNKWLQSDLGVAFLKLTERRRKLHQPNPSLTCEDIESMDIEGTVYKGITIDGDVVSQFFHPVLYLSELQDTGKVNPPPFS